MINSANKSTYLCSVEKIKINKKKVPMLTTKMIGNKIAEARKRANISQARLAERLFISSQAVGKWERGESMPDIIMLNRLAEILSVDLNYFSEDSELPEIEIAPADIPEQPAELPSGKQQKKPKWDLSCGSWADADFSGLKNLHEKFSCSNMQRCLFIDSELSELLLKGNHIDNCDFSRSDISHSQIKGSHLNKNIFKECLLKETEFLRNFINACNFSGVDFTGSKFSESNIYDCDFTGADFTGVTIKYGSFSRVAVKSDNIENNTIAKTVWNRTSFINTQIADIAFAGTLEDCYFESCIFTRVTFQDAKLINTFFKNNKKLKRIKFINCQADRMTYEFLKQGNAELSGITLLIPDKEEK